MVCRCAEGRLRSARLIRGRLSAILPVMAAPASFVRFAVGGVFCITIFYISNTDPDGAHDVLNLELMGWARGRGL